MDRAAFINELRRDEGEIFHVYDDGDRKPVVPGKLMVGHPTIAIGRALDVCPLSPQESLSLTNSSIDAKVLDLTRGLPWASGLDDVRYRVLLNMTFNMGIGDTALGTGLKGFPNMLAAVHRGDYQTASAEMLNSKWATQVGDRAKRLAEMMRTGVAV